MRDRILVVADDLTGAIDTGHGFAARGHRTSVSLSPDTRPPDAAVLVVDTDSRYVEPAEAGRRVRDVVEAVEAAAVYKKVDSTLRGNLGPEIEAAMDAMDAEAAAVAPAFPTNGRLTACEYHLVEGELVTDTEAGTDPDAPVTDPRLPAYLREQGASRVSHVGIRDVAGTDLVGVFDAGGIRTFDVTHPDHLARIAAAAAAAEERVLYVGSGGLAEHVPVPQGRPIECPPVRSDPSGTAFGVAGSVSARTQAQLDALPAEWIVELDAGLAVTDVEGAAVEASTASLETLADYPAVVLTSARTRTAVDAVLETAAAEGVAEAEARERVSAALALATETVFERAAPGGLFCTGGAVARVVLEGLDVDGIELRGESVTTGVPVGHVYGGPVDGTPIVTKAGMFGDDDTIARALEYLRRVPNKRG